MTGTVAPAIPTVGQSDSSEEPKIPSAIITLRDALNAILTSANQVDGAQVATGTLPNTALASIALSKLVPGTDAQIPISNGSAFVAKSLTGDITVNDAGVTAIGGLKVGTSEIAAASVTSPKLSLTTIEDFLSGDITNLSSSWVDILGTSSTVSGATYLVNAFVLGESHNPPNDNTTFDVRVFADGAQVWTMQAISTYSEIFVPITTVYTTSSNAAIKVQAQHNGGATTTDLRANRSRLTAVRIG